MRKPYNFAKSVDLSYVVKVKSTVEILQNFAAFSEYMNFTLKNIVPSVTNIIKM